MIISSAPVSCNSGDILVLRRGDVVGVVGRGLAGAIVPEEAADPQDWTEKHKD